MESDRETGALQKGGERQVDLSTKVKGLSIDEHETEQLPMVVDAETNFDQTETTALRTFAETGGSETSELEEFTTEQPQQSTPDPTTNAVQSECSQSTKGSVLVTTNGILPLKENLSKAKKILSRLADKADPRVIESEKECKELTKKSNELEKEIKALSYEELLQKNKRQENEIKELNERVLILTTKVSELESQLKSNEEGKVTCHHNAMSTDNTF